MYSYGGCTVPSGVTRQLDHCSTQLYRFDTLTQQWNTTHVKNSLPMEGAAHAYHPDSRSLFLFGGRRKAKVSAPGAAPAVNIEYSNSLSRIVVDDKTGPRMVTFVNEGDAPARVEDAVAVVVGDRILVYGGFTEAGFADSVFMADLPDSDADATATVKWQRATLRSPAREGAFPMPRRGHSLTRTSADADRFVLLGGTNGVQSFGDVWELTVSGTSVSWRKVVPGLADKRATFPSPRAFHSAVLASHQGSRVLVLGGCDATLAAPRCFDDVFVLNTETWNWELVPPSLAASARTPLPVQSAVHPDRALAAGVRAPSPRRGASAVFLPASALHTPRVLVVGGCSLRSCRHESRADAPGTHVQRHVFALALDAICAGSCVSGAYAEELAVRDGELLGDDDYIGPHCQCSPFAQGRFCQNALECPNRCSGKGECRADGGRAFCECAEGFWGSDCATPTCRRNCSGRGICKMGPNPLYTSKTPFSFAGAAAAVGSGGNLQDALLGLSDQAKAAAKDIWFRSQSHCECRPGFYGRECALVRDDETARACPASCSGHGLCDADAGRCECHAGFAGADCSIACPSHCSGHGVCTHDGICKCKPGFSGPDCSVTECLNDCSGHGVCDADKGQCDCVPGWGGLACDIPTECSGHGKWVHGRCECDDGYGNAQCSQPVTCPGGCSGRGQCKLPVPVADESRLLQKPIAHADSLAMLDTHDAESVASAATPLLGACECPSGYRGDKCQFQACAHRCRHGFCGDDGTCECYPGHHGPDCSLASNCAHNCTSAAHGSCRPDGQCECRDGWHGEDCGVPGCPAMCSERGQCRDGHCYCDQGFSGPGCEQECVNKCSGNGECIAGKCLCAPGFLGEDCSERASCPRSKSVHPDQDCAGRGFCWRAKKQCICEPAFTGPDCSEAVGVCEPDTCGAHGTCRHGQCFCDLGWSGDKCEVANACVDNCNERGLCLHGRCHCFPGYEGASCEKYVRDATCPDDCGGNGFCMHGRCYCEDGFGGPSCADKTGFCATTTCSGNGVCSRGKCHCQAGSSGLHCELGGCRKCDTAQGMCVNSQCHCKPGFSGTDCGTPLLCPNGCSSHGVCILGTCACLPGFSGQDCSVPTGAKPQTARPANVTHPATPPASGDTAACNGHGVFHDGKCYCVAGFEGLDCNIVKEGNCPNKCGNHGQCRFERCWCQPGYYGKACEFKHSCDKCTNGVCHHNTCHCLPGFQGADCTERVLLPTAEPAPTTSTSFLDSALVTPAPATMAALLAVEDQQLAPATPVAALTAFAALATPCGPSTHGCSRHGVCVADDAGARCVCVQGYSGHDCAQTVGGQMWHRCPKNCNSRGTCLLGKCYCDLGFNGDDCGMEVPLPCPRDCGGAGRGVCQLGRCYCLPGFSGPACETEAPCDLLCGAHGVCYRDKCICAAGYTGRLCERPIPQQLVHKPAPLPAREITEEENLFTLLQVAEQDEDAALSALDVSLVADVADVASTRETALRCGPRGHWSAKANACFCRSGYAGSRCDVRVDAGASSVGAWLHSVAQWMQVAPVGEDLHVPAWLIVALGALMGVAATLLLGAGDKARQLESSPAIEPLLSK
jgi:hypothetical protein